MKKLDLICDLSLLVGFAGSLLSLCLFDKTGALLVTLAIMCLVVRWETVLFDSQQTWGKRLGAGACIALAGAVLSSQMWLMIIIGPASIPHYVTGLCGIGFLIMAGIAWSRRLPDKKKFT